jgi:RND family efflux transporter MFP subunit
MRKPLSSLLFVATAFTVACTGGSPPAQEPAAAAATPLTVDVSVVTATRGTIEQSLDLSGTLAPRARVAVKPRLPGTLERVLVDIGDPVTAGQPVATLDRREIDAQADAAAAAVAVARAGLETAEASLSNAQLEFDRAKVLFDKGALPRQRLDGAQTAHRAAVAQRDLASATLAQAEAAQRRAREFQRDTTLTSPVTGYVVERNYDPGAMPTDRPVVVVADLRQMKLEAGVSELEAGRLRPGMKARVDVQAKPGQVFEAEVANIAPEVSERNRQFRVELRVPNDNRMLLSGMYASARIIESDQTDALLVPTDAIVTRDGARVAIRIEGDQAVPVPVTEGARDGRRIQVLSGLKAGDQVLADAKRPIAPGTRVRPVPVQ